MHAVIEIEENVLTAKLLPKVLKDERIFHSRVIVGQADGTLIYFDPAGHIHVVHGTGPGPGPELVTQAKSAVLQITQGVEALNALGMKMG